MKALIKALQNLITFKKSSNDQVYQKMYNLENNRISQQPKKSPLDRMKAIQQQMKLPSLKTNTPHQQEKNSTIAERTLK